MTNKPKLRNLIFLHILLILSFTLLSSGPSLAAVSKRLKSGIEVLIPAPIQIDPGSFGIMVFTFRNPTTSEVALGVDFSSKLGWTLLGQKKRIILKPAQEEYVALSTMAPTNVPFGTEDVIQLVVREEEVEPERVSVFTTEVNIKMLRKASLSAPNRVHGKAGTRIKIPILVSNQGSVTETPQYSVFSESGWEFEWEIAQANIIPGQTLQTVLNCRIPETSLIGQTDYLNLKVITGTESTEPQELRIAVIVSETADYKPGFNDLTIPLYSSVNLNLRPDETGNISWLGGLRLTGDLNPQLNMDLFFAGEGVDEESTNPSLYLALTGKNWLMRTGAFDPGWEGLIEEPTPTAMLYFQSGTPTQEKWKWHFWLGSEEELYSKPRWVGASLEGPGPNLVLNYLHSMTTDSLFSDAFEAEFTPTVFLSDPNWDFSVTGVAGTSTDNSGFLTQNQISLTRYFQNWLLTGELTSGDEFYQTFFQTERFTKLSLSAEIEASPLLTVEPLFEYKLAQDFSGNKRIIRTYQTGLYYDQHRLLIRHEDASSEKANELELGLWHEVEQDKTIALTLGLSNNQFPTRTDTRVNTRENTLDTYSYSIRTRQKITSVSYLENYITHTQYKKAEDKTFTGYGLRWNHSSASKWQNGGYFQMNTPQEGIPRITTHVNIGYRITPSTTVKLGNSFFYDPDLTEYKLSFFLFHQDLFLIPVPWGGVSGRVYSDRNFNVQYDRGERGLENIRILLDGKESAVSAADGSWMIPRVRPGRHVLSVQYSKEDQDHLASETTYELDIEANRIHEVDIPFHPPHTLKGLLFLDENQNNLPDPQESLLSDTLISVRRLGAPSSEILTEVTTEFDGSFFLSLHPGDYIISVREETLPKEIGILTPVSPVMLSVHQDTAPPIFFALKPKVKEVEFPDLDLPQELLEILE